MKLADFPSSQNLQPLPSQVHADTSESVQRSASPADVQNVQNSAAQQVSSETQSVQNEQGTPVATLGVSTAAALPWILLAVAIIVALGGAWLWRSFSE